MNNLCRCHASLVTFTLALALAACSGDGPRILDTTVIGDTRNTSGPYEVTAIVEADGTVDEVTLSYTLAMPDGGGSGLEPRIVPMRAHGDSSVYRAGIPGQPAGTVVNYWVEAVDHAGQRASDPPEAPLLTFRFVVGQSEPDAVYADVVELPDAADAVGDTGPTELPDASGEVDCSGPLGCGCAAPIVVRAPGAVFAGPDWSVVSHDLELDAATCRERRHEQGELVFQVDLFAGQVVHVSEHGPTFNAVISILAGGSCGPTTPCAVSESFDEEHGHHYTAQRAETVYVVVEALYWNEDDPYDIRIEILTPHCGNDIVEPGEPCDDGNPFDGDGCDAVCRLEGESCSAPLVVTGPLFELGSIDWSWVSDDLELDWASCESEQSGEGELVFRVDLQAGEAVRARELAAAFSGNLSILPGVCDPSAACAASTADEHGGVSYVASAAETVFVVVEARSISEFDSPRVHIEILTPHCGNGVVEPGEPCDDGNLLDGDACSATCQIEGESCSAPLVVTGPLFELTTASWAQVGDDLELDWASCESEQSGEGELVFRVDLQAGEAVVVRQTSPDFDANLSILAGGCGPDTPCAASNEGAASDAAVAYLAQSAETVYVVLESEASSETDAAVLEIEIVEVVCGNGRVEPGEQCDDGNAAGGDHCDASCQLEPVSCASPIVVNGPGHQAAGPDWSVVSHDLVLEGASCTERSGEQGELVFQVALLAGQTVHVSEHGPADVIVSILAGGTCDPSTPCAVSEDSSEASGHQYTATSEETVFVVVEAWSSSEDDAYDIRIEVM